MPREDPCNSVGAGITQKEENAFPISLGCRSGLKGLSLDPISKKHSMF